MEILLGVALMPTIRFEGYSLSLILLLFLSGGDINEYHVGCVFSGLSVASLVFVKATAKDHCRVGVLTVYVLYVGHVDSSSSLVVHVTRELNG